MRLSIVPALFLCLFSFFTHAQIPETDWLFTDDIASATDHVVGMIETSDGGFLFVGEHSDTDCGSGCSDWDDYKRSAYKLSRTGAVQWKTELAGMEGEPTNHARIIELSNNQGYIVQSNLGAVTKLGMNGQLGATVREGFALDHIAYVDNKILAIWNFEQKIYTYDINLNELSDFDASALTIAGMAPSLNPGKVIIIGGENITEYNLTFQVQWTETFSGTSISGIHPYPSKRRTGAGSNALDIIKSGSLTRTYDARDYLLLGTKAGQAWVYADGFERSYLNSIFSSTVTNDGRIILSRADSMVMINGDMTTAWRTNQLTNTHIGRSNDGSLYYYGGEDLRTFKTKPAIFINKDLFFFSNIEYAFCGSPNPDCDATNTFISNAAGQFLDYNNDGNLDYYQIVNRSSLYQPADPPGSRKNSVLNAVVGQSGSQFTVSNKKAYSNDLIDLFNFYLEDFDNDAQLESFDNTLNNISTSNGALTTQVSGLPVITNFNIPTSFADFDNNGLLDVFRNKDAIYLQMSANTYQKLNSATLIDIEHPILIDINNDGAIDVIDPPSKSIYLNQNLVFTKHSVTMTHAPLFPIELNGDGHMDFIAKNGSVFYTAINNGSLSFTYTVLPITYPVFAVGDMNNDGKSDLAGGRYIYFNNGSGTFTKSQNGEYYLPALTGTKGISVGNFDNDGDLDLAVTDSHSLLFIQNNQAVPNQKPSAPPNLRAARAGNVTTFQWDASTDNTTPAASLTYNVYIKRNGVQIVNPNSLASGKRTLINNGNAGFRLAFSKKDLPVGTYQWSVQAIDKSFEPSAFSPENTFYITNPPTNLILSNLSTVENSVNTIGTLTSTDVDVDETHQYSLVAGTGSEDNALFTITGNSLKPATATALDFESRSTYSIRVRTTDSRQGTFEKMITITVTDGQDGATDISLSATSLVENLSIGTEIGTLTSNDQDADADIFSLVAGAGDTDNSSFSISGDKLKAAQVFDYEVKNSYSIRVQTDDQHGQTFQKIFTLVVVDVNDLGKPVIGVPGEITQTQFTLNWPAIEYATGYELEVSIDNFVNKLTGYNPKAINTPSETITGLTAGTVYQARVRAVKGSEKSVDSDVISQITIPPDPTTLEATQVGSDGFKAGWNSSKGATSYELEVSTGTVFVPMEGYDPKIVTGAFDFVLAGLAPQTTYKYRVRAVNSAGRSGISDERSVTTTVASLTIGNPSKSTIQAGFGTTKIPVKVSGDGTKTVTLKHRGILNPGTFSSVSAALKSGEDYEAEVPETAFDELGLEFYFEATNGTSTIKQSSNSYLYNSIPPSANKTIPFVGSFNAEPETYQMFSVPYVLSDANISFLFAPTVGEYNRKNWRLYHYQNSANAEYPVIQKMELGKGYWFNARQSDVQAKIGQAAVYEASQTAPFKMTLAPGWNQVGNPYPFDISWSKVIGSNDKVGELNFYSGGSYTTNNVFKPWTGAFVFADEAMELSIPLTAKGASRVQGQELMPTIDEEVWKVSLQLSLGDMSVQSGIGMHPQAQPSKDRFDKVALPRFINYLELNTNHSEYFAPHFSIDVVPAAENYSWLFDVTSSEQGEKGELTWDHHAISDAESSLILIDLLDQTWIDMKSSGVYSFTQKEGRQLMISYSRNGDIKPGITMLGQAYPNPFQREATIPVLVEDSSEIRIDVYNMLGQRVRTISEHFQKGGVHVLKWDGKDAHGSEISSGMLLYRLSNGTSNVQRMIKQ